MADTVIAPRYRMRYEQLINTPVLDRIPYSHDREIEYILEVSKAEAENVALRAKVAKLEVPVSDVEWSCVPLEGATLPVLKTLATLRVLFDWLIKARAADVNALIAARGREGE